MAVALLAYVESRLMRFVNNDTIDVCFLGSTTLTYLNLRTCRITLYN